LKGEVYFKLMME